MKELVSIIIPVFNTCKYLNETLESIKRQKYNNYEVLLIDDGSYDGSQIICDAYAEKDARFKVYHMKNSGYSVARNYGLSKACGKYVVFVDSDDVLDDELLWSQIDCMNRTNADVAVCFEIKMYKNHITCIKNTNKNYIVIDNSEKNNLLFSQGKYKGSPYAGGQCWKKMIKKTILRNINFVEDRSICEDEIFTKDVFDKANVIALNGKGGYYYRMRTGSAVHDTKFNLKILRGRFVLYDGNKIDKKTLVQSSLLPVLNLYRNKYNDIGYENFAIINRFQLYVKSCFFELPIKQRILALLLLGDWCGRAVKWKIMYTFVTILVMLIGNENKYELFE